MIYFNPKEAAALFATRSRRLIDALTWITITLLCLCGVYYVSGAIVRWLVG